MITVLAAWWPSRTYPFSYVKKLRDAVARNMRVPYTFSVLAPRDAIKSYQGHPGIEWIVAKYGFEHWWIKMEMFDLAFTYWDRIFYIDLDTVIIGSLDEIACYDGPCLVGKDFGHDGPSQYMISFVPNEMHHVWQRFIADPQHWIDIGDRGATPNYGDQTLLNEFPHPDQEYIQDVFPGQVVSFKKDCSEKPPGRNARAVCFHGTPKPADVPAMAVEHHKWVAKHWC